MKKEVLMSIVLLALIGTSAVFAQTPLDKFSFATNTTGYTAMGKDKNMSGAVVIPDTYNGKPVTSVINFLNFAGITSVTFPNSLTKIATNAFSGCTGLKSITIPASVTAIENGAFRNCTSLTSVTFLGTASVALNNANDSLAHASFDGDLSAKYQAGGPGTYTRTSTDRGSVWTKQGGRTLTGTGTYSDGAQVTITGDGTTITVTGTASGGGKFTETYKRQ